MLVPTDMLLVLQAARSSYEAYISLADQHTHHTSSLPQDSSQLLCDRCLQPIDEDTFQTNAWRLEVRSACLLCLLCLLRRLDSSSANEHVPHSVDQSCHLSAELKLATDAPTHATAADMLHKCK